MKRLETILHEGSVVSPSYLEDYELVVEEHILPLLVSRSCPEDLQEDDDILLVCLVEAVSHKLVISVLSE